MIPAKPGVSCPHALHLGMTLWPLSCALPIVRLLLVALSSVCRLAVMSLARYGVSCPQHPDPGMTFGLLSLGT